VINATIAMTKIVKIVVLNIPIIWNYKI